jgi:hypothetical protein
MTVNDNINVKFLTCSLLKHYYSLGWHLDYLNETTPALSPNSKRLLPIPKKLLNEKLPEATGKLSPHFPVAVVVDSGIFW